VTVGSAEATPYLGTAPDFVAASIEYDPVALAVLAFGIAAVELLAFSI
jgi:hypothetical protein